MSDDPDDLLDAHAAIVNAVTDEAAAVSQAAIQARAERDAAVDTAAAPADKAKPARARAKPTAKD